MPSSSGPRPFCARERLEPLRPSSLPRPPAPSSPVPEPAFFDGHPLSATANTQSRTTVVRFAIHRIPFILTTPSVQTTQARYHPLFHGSILAARVRRDP